MNKEKETPEVKVKNEALVKLIKDAEWQIEYHTRILEEQKEILKLLKS